MIRLDVAFLLSATAIGSFAFQTSVMLRQGLLRPTTRREVLGDFERDTYADTVGTVVGFHLLTMLTLVIMLNVLIAIISEEFEKVMARREEESLLKQASTIVDLEAVYLSFATYNGTARGEEVSLVDYSRVLRFYWQHVKKVPAHVVSQLNVGAEYLHTLVPQQRIPEANAYCPLQ